MSRCLRLLTCLALFASCLALAFDAPPGWKVQDDGGVQVFVPGDLQDGEVFEVRIYPRAPMAGVALDAWLQQQGAQEKLPEGKWAGALSAKMPSGNVASGSRAWIDARGTKGAAIYSAISVDNVNGRIARLLVNESPAMQRHRKAATELMGQLGAEEMRVAEKEDRATDIEAAPPKVDHIQAGGPLKPGRYIGNFSSDKKVLRRFDVLLFANGEFQFLEGGSDINPTGEYTYREGTGKLDIQNPLRNSEYNPDEDFCIYGKNAKGEYVIYAEDYYGLGTYKATLTRVADIDRLPPTEAKKKKDAEEAEAERYKYITPPGKGLAAKDIEAIVHTWKQVYEVGGMQMYDNAYMLLKDGTVYDGLPVAPEDWDVGASKKYEQKLWGRWRKDGGAYEFAWEGGSDFQPLQNASVVKPAGRNARLEGNWSGAWSISGVGGSGSWRNWGVLLTKDGKFTKYASGGHGSGLMGEMSGTGVTTGAVYDDEGAVSVVSGPNFGGGSSSKSEKTKADRSGTYTLNGYTLELRYANGAVARLPFFLSEGKSTMIWFEGSMLAPAKE